VAGDHGYEPTTMKCPYGRPGDHLWIKETWTTEGADARRKFMESGAISPEILYRADTETARKLGDTWKWNSALFMPRWAARSTREIVAIRVERVQQITEADALAEGIQMHDGRYGFGPDCHKYHWCSPVLAYRELWDFINDCRKPVKGLDGQISHYVSYPWEDVQYTLDYKGKPWYVVGNPWVWVIQFGRIS